MHSLPSTIANSVLQSIFVGVFLPLHFTNSCTTFSGVAMAMLCQIAGKECLKFHPLIARSQTQPLRPMHRYWAAF